MRGHPGDGSDLFHTFHLEDIVPAAHPLRMIKQRSDAILRSMSRRFNEAYGKTGRLSVPPERLIKAMLLQALFSIRSDRQLCEQIQYNMLFRWFLDKTSSEAVCTPESFSMNRERFDVYELPRQIFDREVNETILEGLVSDEHFSVDGTLIQSWASQRSSRPIGTTDEKVSESSDDDDPCDPTVDSRRENRSNATHRSLIDIEAILARKGKGKPARLSHSGHVLMENRNGLCVDVRVDVAGGSLVALRVILYVHHQALIFRTRDTRALEYSAFAKADALSCDSNVSIRSGDRPPRRDRRTSEPCSPGRSSRTTTSWRDRDPCCSCRHDVSVASWVA